MSALLKRIAKFLFPIFLEWLYRKIKAAYLRWKRKRQRQKGAKDGDTTEIEKGFASSNPAGRTNFHDGVRTLTKDEYSKGLLEGRESTDNG